jgi:hypothetical protein
MIEEDIQLHICYKMNLFRHLKIDQTIRKRTFHLLSKWNKKKNRNSVLKFFSDLVYKFETYFNLYMITYSNRILKTRSTYMTSVWEKRHANRSADTATQSAAWQLHNFTNYLFPLLLSTGVLQAESPGDAWLKYLSNLFFVTCPSEITKWFIC